MSKFTGFTSSETFTQVPDAFFHLLKEIEDLAELKVALYAIWRVEHIEGNFRALCESDFEAEPLGLTVKEIQRGLKKAVERGVLLEAGHAASPKGKADVFYFLNSPRGRLAAEAFSKGDWRGSAQVMSAPLLKSNVFRLYEENIGPLTPLIADMLREAEKNYPSIWFEEAFEIAVSRNIRNWKYVEAILTRWKDKGKDERRDRESPVKDSDRYTDSEFSEFLKRD